MTLKTRIIAYSHQEEREAEKRPLSFRLISRLFSFARPYRRQRFILIMLVIFRAIQLPCLAWAMGAIIGGPVTRMDTRGILLGTAGYGLLAFITQLVFRYRVLVAQNLGENVVADVRKNMFRHIQCLPMSFYHKTRLGRIISRFTSDTESVRQGVQDVLFVTMVQTGQMLIAAFFMIWYDKVLFLVVVAMAPMLWALNRYFHSRLSRVYRASQESFSRVTAALVESVNGIRVTQGYVREDLNADIFQELVTDHSRYNMDAARVAGTFIPLLELKSQLFVALILFIGGWRVMHGFSSVESLYQFLLMAGNFFAPIQGIGNQYNVALSAMAGAERVFNLMDTSPEWSDPPDAVAVSDCMGEVEFENVTFGYNPQKPVLHDINFVASPGQTVALVGHTGSGKSSIINLIAKFYLPTQGRLLIDGRDIRGINSESLHRKMGIVLQENFLFTGTVLDNIRVGKPDATREDVVRVAKELDCLDLIASLSDGFNTVVGEKGSGISLGQRQLICITRAMLANPRLLIMDEATSSVDTMTEARIQKAIERLLTNRTSFVVAHRLSTIRHADVVLVLEDGRIVETGTHEDLLKKGRLYADLYREFIRSAEA